MTQQNVEPKEVPTYPQANPAHHFDVYTSIRPMSGRVLVRFDLTEPITQPMGTVWLVDTKTIPSMKYRWGWVLAVSRHGKIVLGNSVVPHELKVGDRIVCERAASKEVPGQKFKTPRPGTVGVVWENYVLAVAELEPGDADYEEQQRIIGSAK